MNSARFTVSGLLWGVAVLACVCAALRFANGPWTNAIATATFLLLMTGVAGACFATDVARAFWGGFALFGISYLVLVNWDWVGGQFGHDLTGALNDLAESVFPAPQAPPAAWGVQPGQGLANLSYQAAVKARDDHIGNFVQIGRMVLSLACALAGGLISRRFAARAASRSDP